MANDRKTLEAVRRGSGTVSFRDFEHLLVALGFRLVRIAGSHYIYAHRALDRPFPIQSDGKDAKRYQVRQLRDIIERHGLTLDSTP